MGRDRAHAEAHPRGALAAGLCAACFGRPGANGPPRLFSGAADETVRAWDASTGALLCALKGSGHAGWVRLVAVSPDGAVLASCADDKTVRCGAALAGCVGRADQGAGGAHRGRLLFSLCPRRRAFVVSRLGRATARCATGRRRPSARTSFRSPRTPPRCWPWRSARSGSALAGGGHARAGPRSGRRGLEVGIRGVQSLAVRENVLLAGSADDTARLLDLADGREVHVREGHSDW